MIKILKFDGHWIVAEVEEIPGQEIGDPDCVLKYPCEILSDGDAVRFPRYSRDSEIIVRSTDITLIAEPTDVYLQKYISLKPIKESE